MIPTKIVREKTGLTQGQLNRLRRLHLIPKATRIPATGRQGYTYAYPATVLNSIRLIKILRAKGIPLTRIARQVRGTPLECVDAGPSADRGAA